MVAQPDTPSTEPRFSEVVFYLGIGAFFAFVVVLAVGFLIYGYHLTGDVRDARGAAEGEAAVAEDLDTGAQLFAQRCASCHGPDGGGGIGPAFAGITQRFPDAADHIDVVRQGRGQMPSFDRLLSDSQIELIVTFEREVLDGN